MFSALLILAAAVVPAFATVYTTAPVDSTTWAANAQQTISWQDDGAAPSLKDFGVSKVSVYVGNQQQQTLVQAISDNVDVSTTSSIVFTPQASYGENGKYYFIRFESVNLKDPKNPQYPALAFSSKYTMTGMTGTFTAEVKAQIAGATDANAATTSPAATSSTSKVTTSKASTSASPTGSAAGKSAGDNGASALPISALTCAAGVAIAVFSAMLM